MKRQPHDDLDPARGIIWVLLGALVLVSVASAIAAGVAYFGSA